MCFDCFDGLRRLCVFGVFVTHPIDIQKGALLRNAGAGAHYCGHPLWTPIGGTSLGDYWSPDVEK